MRLLRDFRCHECGKLTERYTDTDINQITCECGGVAARIIGMPHVSLEGISGAFPGAADHWAKIREQRHRQQAKNQDG